MGKNYRAELVGLFGFPVDENPTGIMEEAAFAAKGLNFRYITMQVKPGHLKEAMAGLRAMNMRGINLTIPHKVEVIPFLDELTPSAEITGAVNTVVNNNGILLGENTDGKGFLTSLQDAGIDVAGKHLVLLGAGGAARAIATECALAGANVISVVNRSRKRGEEMVQILQNRTRAKANYIPWGETPLYIPADTDILCNATSLGLFPNIHEKPDLDYDSIRSGMVVTDVIFNDPNSLFLQEAKKRNAVTIDGLGMLVNQGALNFTLWTGEQAPVELMTAVLKKEFGL